MPSMQLHATCVAIGGRGVLLRGPSGSGKSDLALRLIDQSGCGTGSDELRGELVGDDQIVLTRRGDVMIASPAAQLAGLLEVRGIGIVRCEHIDEAPVSLVVELTAQYGMERLPGESVAKFEELQLSVPSIAVDAAQPSAAARVRAGLIAVQTGFAAQ